MQIRVNTDRNIEGTDELRAEVESAVSTALDRFATRLTRVEVHLSDESSAAKSVGNDKRCVLEARPANMKPISVSNDGPTVEQAVSGAADKLQKVLSSTFGKLDDHKGRTSMSGE